MVDVGFTDKLIDPPAAIEVRVTLSDWGELSDCMSCRHSNKQQGAALVIALLVFAPCGGADGGCAARL